MSRSKRKTPITGNTTSESEKQAKRAYNRRYRHVCKLVIANDTEHSLIPSLREHSNPWGMDKDGKSRFDPGRYPELMRK